MTLEEWRTIFSGVTLVSVLFVVLNYWLARGKAKNDSEIAKDKEICDQAINALERAYLTLTGENGNTSAPEASRLNWLTTSRQIIRFKKLKSKLKTDLYKLVCSEHEEHWRHQFFLCLEYSDLSSESYYQDRHMLPLTSENIDSTSALVIINFKQWNPDLDDPLNDVDKNQLLNDGYTLNGERGLSDYIATLDAEREAIRNAS